MSCRVRGATVCAALATIMACGEGSNDRDDSDRRGSDSPEAVTSVYLRLSNSSEVSFDDVLVQFAEPIEFGALDAGAVSDYLQADGIYSYSYIEGTSGEQSYILQPTDYIGEMMLSPGYYTYVLSVVTPAAMAQAGSLDVRLLRDAVPR